MPRFTATIHTRHVPTPRAALTTLAVAGAVSTAITPLGAQDAAVQPRRRSLDAAVTVQASTLGVGVELAKLVASHLAVRVGGSVLSYNRTQQVDAVTYDGAIKLRNASVLVDLFPGRRGSFRITGGVLMGNSELTGTGVPGEDGFTLDGTTYTSAEVGTLSGAINFPRTRPYVGLGWGTPANTGFGVRLVTDLGVAFGRPSLSLAATGAAAGSALAADLEAQRTSTQQDLDKYAKLYPVFRTGLSFRF